MIKKIIPILTLAVMTAVSPVINAEGTTDVNVSYNSDGTLSYVGEGEYQTVIIENDEGEIYYVDQAKNTFDALTNLKVKELVQGITYTINMYSPSTDSTTTSQFVIDGEEPDGVDFRFVGSYENMDGTFNYGYRLDKPATLHSSAVCIQFTYAETPITYYAGTLPTMSGTGAIGIQINNVPSELKGTDISVTLTEHSMD